MSTDEFATVSEHGVLFEQFGVAGRVAPLPHKLCEEERDATRSCDHHCLPEEPQRQQEGAIWEGGRQCLMPTCTD